MKYRQIINDAWAFTQSHKGLIRWYAFLPSLLTLIYGILYFTYQFYAFKSSVIFEGWEQSFFAELIQFIFDFLIEDPNTALPAIITIAIFGVLYLFLPAICQGALIQLIARRYNGQQVRTIEGIKYGLLSFLRLFQFQLLTRGLSFVAILAPAATFLRTFGLEALPFLSAIFSLFLVMAFILNLLFTYADFYIVIDSEDVFPSISKSCGLVVSHWQMTFLIGILMLIIGARIVLQVLIVMLIPALVIFIGGYVATVALAQTGLIIGGVIGGIALLFAAYFSAIIHVFAVSVWVITFLELSNEQESSAREAAAENLESAEAL